MSVSTGKAAPRFLFAAVSGRELVLISCCCYCCCVDIGSLPTQSFIHLSGRWCRLVVKISSLFVALPTKFKTRSPIPFPLCFPFVVLSPLHTSELVCLSDRFLK